MLEWICRQRTALRFRFLFWKHGQPSARPLPFSPVDPEAQAGLIRFQIYDDPEKRIVDRGEIDLSAQSFSIEEVAAFGETRYRKSIVLTDRFVLSLMDQPALQVSEKAGFGLTVSRTDLETFCWEWFVQNGIDHAIKLQETGELRLRRKYSAQGWEIAQTKFLTKIDFRVYEADADVRDEPRWRVTVFARSKIQWPTGVR